MRFVIDTNRIIAALIKNSTSRSIIFHKNFTFVTPDHTLSEIKKYEEFIKKKAHIAHEEFETVLAPLFEHIEIIPEEEYEQFIQECTPLISDIDDIHFLAVATALKADGIWSDDAHFQEQHNIKIFTTKDLAC